MKTSNLAIIASTVLASVTLVAAVGLVAFAPADADLGLLIGLLFTNVGTMVTGIVGLVLTEQVRGTVDELANGKMDAKIRAGVADVLPDHMVDPKVRPQVARDRATRDQSARDHA